MKNILLITVAIFIIIGCSKAPFDIIPVSSDYIIPKFINKDFTDIDKIMEISKFRSSTGHDYSDSFESNRSMKHYYYPYDRYKGDDNTVKIYSPVDGFINRISIENAGQSNDEQVHINPNGYSYMTIILFHINCFINPGEKITAGQHIGYASLSPKNGSIPGGFDIAVKISTKKGSKLISYFDIMTDELFATYQIKGIQNRDALIITKEWRDTNSANFSGRDENNFVRF